MTTLRNLNRAVQAYTYPSVEWAQAVREMLNEVAERMEPKRWCCDRCRAPLGDDESHRDKETGDYSCKFDPFASAHVEAYEKDNARIEAYFRGRYDERQLHVHAEPASEGAKVECENCKQIVDHENSHKWTHPNGPDTFDGCPPAQPEPAAPKGIAGVCYSIDGEQWHEPGTCPYCTEPAAPGGEMPDALDTACDLLEWGGNVNAAAALRDAWRTHAAQPKVADMYGYIKCELDDLLGSCGAIVALEGVPLHWKFAAEIRDKAKALAAKVEIADVSRRTGFSPPAAQPKVAMTEELERCLSTLHILAGEMGTNVGAGVRADIAAVRSQAAGVKLPKVRALIEEVSSDRYDGKQYRHLLTAALAELDRLERKP